jgi:preprotein translocase subunit SecE
VGAFFQELLRFDIYKRNQGRITRQVTFAAVVLAFLASAWRLHTMLAFMEIKGTVVTKLIPAIHFWLPCLLLAAGAWIAFRLVNMPAFADFLISVEMEMNKVSWPTRAELLRASAVVLFVIFVLAVILAGFDYLWGLFFRLVIHLY